MSDDFIYGPFLDEDFFFFHDKHTIIELDAVQFFHAVQGFVGLDDLEKIQESPGGRFDQVMFSGVATLLRANWLCEHGFRALLREAEKCDPTMTPNKLRQCCKQGDVKVELHCQLASMPVCYMTKRMVGGSVVMCANNMNNISTRRRYIANTFHFTCFRRSELTLQRYMLLKFIVDTCRRHANDVPREKRNVHWLVSVYLEDYAAVFKNRRRPRLHRSEVYDHFATHANWLGRKFAHKLLVDKDDWKDWMLVESKMCKVKARHKKLNWGKPFKGPVIPEDEQMEQCDNLHLDDATLDDMRSIFPDTESESDTDPPVSSASSSASSDNEEEGPVQYAHHVPTLLARTHPGLFNRMPLPTWYWMCDITDDCPFIIDLGSKEKRDADALCMAPLTPKETTYLREKVWGLYDRRFGRIWKKMCQTHMDWHWREVGLVIDHEGKRIYAVEEDDT